jgi:hypothetical protein
MIAVTRWTAASESEPQPPPQPEPGPGAGNGNQVTAGCPGRSPRPGRTVGLAPTVTRRDSESSGDSVQLELEVRVTVVVPALWSARPLTRMLAARQWPPWRADPALIIRVC